MILCIFHVHVHSQLYDQVQTTEIVLYNGGKVDLDFCALGLMDTPPDKLSPGEVSVSPLTGNIAALEHQKLTVHYLPGVPKKFHEKLEIQVAHFEPDEITITGAAIFPRIGFSVPQSMDDIRADIQSEARMNVGVSVEGCQADVSVVPASEGEQDLCSATTEFQAEVERLLVKDFAEENSEKLFGVSKRNPKLRYSMSDCNICTVCVSDTVAIHVQCIYMYSAYTFVLL